jgi:cell division septum initiation protein DivIVA
MSAFDKSNPSVSFRTRPFGYDRQEVQAFVKNILDDYAAARRELQQALKTQSDADTSLEKRNQSEIAAREVARILAGAERIADEVKAHASDEYSHLISEAEARAADIVAEAERRAADLLADAERRSAEVVGSAARRSAELEDRAMLVRAQHRQLRRAFEAAADTAATALSEIANLENQMHPSGAEPAAVPSRTAYHQADIVHGE